MNYRIKAYPTVYDGVQFRSRLEARWAVFFDLAGWKWEYEPIDLEGWTPDFHVSFSCSMCECSHTLLVEVKPYFDVSDFDMHPCMEYTCGVWYNAEGIATKRLPADASAAFGCIPTVTYWEIMHQGKVYAECVEDWVYNTEILWGVAGNRVQYKGSQIECVQ